MIKHNSNFNRHSFAPFFCRLTAVTLALALLLGGCSGNQVVASQSASSVAAATASATVTPTATPSPEPTPTPSVESINGLPDATEQSQDDGSTVSKVKPNQEHTEFTVVYEDGDDEGENYTIVSDWSPDLVSVFILGDELILEVDGSGAESLYAVYESDGCGGFTGDCIATRFGKSHFVIRLRYSQSYLYRQLVVVAMHDGEARISNGLYIQNPEAVAEYDYDYPQQASKKGLQISESKLDDVAELGVKHAVVNVPLEKLLEPSEYDSDPEEFYFAGGHYGFNHEYVEKLDNEFGALGAMGITTNAVLVLQFSSDTTDLIYPGATTGSHRYYALNLSDPEKVQLYAAIFTFLAERYSAPEYGVTNWILGNEVGNYTEWNWSGNVSFETYMLNYVQAFRILYQCTRAVYANSKCMISLDHCWNQKRDGAYTSREVLDFFAQQITANGPCEWWLAYHPYSEPLTDTSFWSADSRVTDSLSTECITMKNLNVLTDYIRDTYGSEHKLVLSETGFSSSTQGEETQAAAIAYAYMISEANDMVSSLIIHRHVDEPEESATNLALGLWTLSDTKKQSWQVFRDMDTDPTSTQFALKLLGASSWDQLV